MSDQTRGGSAGGRPRNGGRGGRRRRVQRPASSARPRTSQARTRSPQPATPPRRRAVPAVLAVAGAHEEADRENAARVAANRRRTQALCAAAALLPALVVGVVVGVAAGPVPGVVVAVVVAVAVWVVVLRGSLGFALGLVGGRSVGAEEVPSLANQVDGLCATIGVARPELRVLADGVPNACALAGPGRGVLVVTSGLLDRLGLIEMEGVVAHELVHLKRRDAVVSAVSVATAGLVAYALGMDGLVHAALGRGREYGADQAAVLAVRYPPGLRDALAAMEEADAAVAGGGPTSGAFAGRRWAATRWVWVDPMLGRRTETAAGELDATAVRRAALAEW